MVQRAGKGAIKFLNEYNDGKTLPRKTTPRYNVAVSTQERMRVVEPLSLGMVGR